MKMRRNQRMRIGLLAMALFMALYGRTALGQAAPAPSADVAGATTAKPDVQSGQPAADENFVIGTDDQLGINVWNEPDLKQTVPVRSDGKISLPLIGDVQAAGRTPLQLQQDIADKLRTFITRPNVTVMVMLINSRKFNVLGRVAKPGSYPLSATTTVLDAIAGAGGFQDFAKVKDIYILRKSADGTESRIAFNYKDVIKGKHPEQNIRLEPHDTIVVP